MKNSDDPEYFILLFIKSFLVLIIIGYVLPYIIDYILFFFFISKKSYQNSVFVYTDFNSNRIFIGKYIYILKNFLF